MKIFIPREDTAYESRVAMVPNIAEKLIAKGAKILMEKGASLPHSSDTEFESLGVEFIDRKHGLATSDIIIRLRKPSIDEASVLKPGSIHISYMDPFNDPDLVDAFNTASATSISLEMIPRTTLAQKMDVLSSQASLAGYSSVILAAHEFQSVFPMMMTPAGTLPPAKVFVIGAGVAGLQAIATAKRLGARVEAFDTRPVVEEQVTSLGASFVKVDLGTSGQTEQGYAKALTDEQLDRQRAVMAERCAASDIIITTAQLFGRQAPRIINEDMIRQMKKGSIIVDMAVSSGGNVAGSVTNETVDIGGVKIIGFENFPAFVARSASDMLSSNLYHYLTHFWDTESQSLHLSLDDDIAAGSVITHGGELINPAILSHRSKGQT